ncbi:MAG: DUF1697 domain-containing protein [Chitinophagaceae bacterium]|nr:DUF1697 domain-containing protein [Chitinophagaceae bacterium]
MTTYISILRGINVSGQKLIKMDALKKMYEKLNFENIQTYIQSSNVIFSTNNTNTKELEKIISSKIETTFGYDVPVIVISVNTLKTIIENNPFAKDSQKDKTYLHITFLAEIPIEFNKESIIEKKCPDEEIVFTSNAIYLYCPNGYGKTKLNNQFLEKKLKVKATTRNWKKSTELLKLTKL